MLAVPPEERESPAKVLTDGFRSKRDARHARVAVHGAAVRTGLTRDSNQDVDEFRQCRVRELVLWPVVQTEWNLRPGSSLALFPKGHPVEHHFHETRFYSRV
jgi:hypothetical protein